MKKRSLLRWGLALALAVCAAWLGRRFAAGPTRVPPRDSAPPGAADPHVPTPAAGPHPQRSRRARPLRRAVAPTLILVAALVVGGGVLVGASRGGASDAARAAEPEPETPPAPTSVASAPGEPTPAVAATTPAETAPAPAWTPDPSAVRPLGPVQLPQPPARRPAPPSNPLLPLAARLAPLIYGFEASAGVAVIDLQTGDSVALHGHQQFQAASTIKFFATLSALTDIAEGQYEFADIEDDLYGIMVLQSNAHARELTLRTGIPTINDRLAEWGLANTVITHPSGYTWEPDPAFEDVHNDNLTSPADAAAALAMLYRAEIGGDELSRALIERMTQAPREFGIEGAVPDADGHVYYKVGWLPVGGFSSVNDIGIVEFERGGRTLAFAVAIYTQGSVPQWPAWQLVRDLAEEVWRFFGEERYPAEPAAADTAAT